MANYDDLKARIANEIARSDLSNEIIQNIASAVLYYSGEKFSPLFNNPLTPVTFNTVAGTQYYSIAAIGGGSSGLIDHEIFLTLQDGTAYHRLDKIPPIELENLRQSFTVNRSRPDLYAVYGEAFGLHPIPDRVYTITVGFYQNLTPLSAGTDSNFWTNQGEELIRSRAKKTLYQHVILDMEQVASMEAAEREAYNNLKVSTTRQVSSGRISPRF